jgi:predicted ATPase
MALYDPVKHSSLATRFGQDIETTILSYRSLCLWLLGYVDAALRDSNEAVKNGRKTGQATSLMFALFITTFVHLLCGNHSIATVQANELSALAEEKRALYWHAFGMEHQGVLLAERGKAADAVRILISAIVALRSTGATLFVTSFLSYLARAYAEIGNFDDAWHCMNKTMTAIETSKERVWEAEVSRVAGEIALMSLEPDAAKAEAYFESALAVARKQQAKSWELRAAMSMARLWRDQGKRDEARDLLAPVYGWFTEGFDTLDLKEAKVLLDELAS